MLPEISPSSELNPGLNSEAFSRKNCLFSGKNIENLDRLFTWRSASACAKSVLIVASATRLGVKAHLISPPVLNETEFFFRRDFLFENWNLPVNMGLI